MAAPSLSATAEAAFIRIGDQVVALALLDKGAATQSVEAGEVRLYGPGSSNASAIIRIRANGSIEITPLAGVSIVLAGGTLSVARETDPVSVTLSALQIATIIAPPGGGPCTGGPITLSGTISSGAPQVKA
jgi:hypothetical protein